MLYLVKYLGLRDGLKLGMRFLYAHDHYLLLRANLQDVPDPAALRKPEGFLVKGTRADLRSLPAAASGMGFSDKKDLLSRIHFYDKGFTNCYIFKMGERIAHLQWIVYPSENAVIAASYRKKFYPLSENQIMMENAFTLPEFRGRAILLYVTLALLVLGRDAGYKSALCYIRADNIPSINTFLQIGFRITQHLHDYKCCGFNWRTL